jgi:hypothetical protein
MLLTRALFVSGIAVNISAAAGIDFQSTHYAIGLSRRGAAFTWFALDSLGRGAVTANPVLEAASTNGVALSFEATATNRFVYRLKEGGQSAPPLWELRCEDDKFMLLSGWVGVTNCPPFTLLFNQKANHATLLGLMELGERRTSLPCVLHLPDMGSARITGNVRNLKVDYDARRYSKPAFVRIAFPPATPSHPLVQYTLEVVALYPYLRGIEKEARFDGFRRSFLDIFQVNPRLQMLANNSSSDPCAFTVYEYSEMALHAPPLAKGLTCLDLIRMTIDRYLAGVKGYGQVGYGTVTEGADIIGWQTPYTSSDSLPSLLIAACNYITGTHDWEWARTNYNGLAAWAGEMMETDHDGNGLIEYQATGNYGDRPRTDRRPSNWWDTINFGHEDAYANALAYRACNLFAGVARHLGHKDDARMYETRARRLRAAYVPAFLNPETGILAGWRSADGKLHDYWFTFVNGVAITYGLVDARDAGPILDRLIDKMARVGYTNFHLGLPGNLVPVHKGDYADHSTPPEVHGVPRLEDGSDGFQFYENGGATACFAGFFVQALYETGRVEAARRIFYPMLESYAAGDFQGFCSNGPSKDWRDWSGGCHGYEGFLVDSYLGLLPVLDEVKVPRR